MSNSDTTTAIELSEFELVDAATMDSETSSRVCVNENPPMSKSAQIENLRAFIRTRNRNFNRWQQQRDC